MNLCEEGTYNGNLVGAEFDVTDNGKDRTTLTFEIDGSQRKVFLYWSGGAAQYTAEKLKHLGWNGDIDSPEFSNTDNIELSCKHEEYQGKTRERWDIWVPRERRAPDSQSKANIKSLWRAQGGGAAPKTPTGKPTAPPKPAAPKAPSKGPPKAPPKDETADRDAPWVENEESAWQKWSDAAGGDEVDQDRWFAVIEATEKKWGVPRAEFAGAAWAEVAKAAVPI